MQISRSFFAVVDAEESERNVTKDLPNATDGEDSFRQYLLELRQYPLLSPEKELEVARRAAQGDAVAREQLINANLRLVVSAAKRFQNRGIPIQDLVQDGNLGLLQAVSKFDPEKGFRFSTYAVWWINQYILRGIADKGRAIRVPVHALSEFNRLLKIAEQFRIDHQRTPSIEELATAAETSEKRVKELFAATREIISLDLPIGEEENMTLIEAIPDLSEDNTDVFLQQKEAEDHVEQFLSVLPAREREILALRFGIGCSHAHTLAEVAVLFGLSRERIRQIEDRALHRLRTSHFFTDLQKNQSVAQGGV